MQDGVAVVVATLTVTNAFLPDMSAVLKPEMDLPPIAKESERVYLRWYKSQVRWPVLGAGGGHRRIAGAIVCVEASARAEACACVVPSARMEASVR